MFLCRWAFILLSTLWLASCNKVNKPAQVDQDNGENKPLAAESGPSTARKTQKMHHRKPGAPINFSHNYDGSTMVGEPESFELQLSSDVQGILQAQVYSRDNILVGNDIERSEMINPREALIIPVTVNSSTEGKFYLNVQATTGTGEGQMSRAFSMAIYVGDWKNAENHKTTQTKVSEDQGEKVIIMPAQETIR